MQAASIAAIERVYRRRYRQFARVAVAELGNRDAAHDAVQDAFARAIGSRHGYRGRGSLDAWIWRILMNVCVSMRRAHIDMAAGPSRDQPAADPPSEFPEVRAALG